MKMYGTYELAITGVSEKKRLRAYMLVQAITQLWGHYSITTIMVENAIVVMATVPEQFVLSHLEALLELRLTALTKKAQVTRTTVKAPVDIFA